MSSIVFPIVLTVLLWLWAWTQPRLDMQSLVSMVIAINGTIGIWVIYFVTLGIYHLSIT